MIKVNLQGLNKETKRFSSKIFFSPTNKMNQEILDYSIKFLFNKTKIDKVVEGYGHDLNPDFFESFCQDYQKENKQLGNSFQSVEQGRISGVFCLKNKK